MALPDLVSDEHIRGLEDKESDALNAMFNQFEKSKLEAWERKERWLGVYAQCLSPSVACRQTDITLDTYRRWRKTDPRFCKGLNHCIEQAQEELVGSVLARATGYARKADVNAPTESGLEEDAEGKIIRYGASDALAKSVLGLDKPEQGTGKGDVTVVIDLGALTGAHHARPVLGGGDFKRIDEGDDA